MKVALLAGGVGGARLAHGLSRILGSDLTVIVNTGDDLEHWGLAISPDVDTVMYTLAGLGDAARGWGLAGETFGALEQMRRYGEADWFNLGDRDLATHLVRTKALRDGHKLSEITDRMRKALGVRSRILPMCDEPVRTIIDTPEGSLPFQEWLVRRRAAPRVNAVRFEGSRVPAPGVLEAIAEAAHLIIAPSNPYVSIDPIPVSTAGAIAVSPIVKGEAVKGPLARMIVELRGEAPSPAVIAKHYGKLRGMVVERGDEAGIDVPVLATSIVMKDEEDRARLAREVLDFARGLS
jgi:LPPG:FO 2-phospho-L-lactate transferase